MEGFGTPGRIGGSQGAVQAGSAGFVSQIGWWYSFGTGPTSMHPTGPPLTHTGVGGLNQGP